VYEALLFRLNPEVWPTWRNDILAGCSPLPLIDIGRRIREELGPGIPIIALGTDGLGVVAIGKTVTDVSDCIDPDWADGPPEYQADFRQIKPRIAVHLSLVNPIADFRENEIISGLLYRRDTLNPISLEMYGEFEAIC